MLNVRFTTNGVCAKEKHHIIFLRTSNNRVIAARKIYLCLVPQCEALCTACHSSFPIATKWYCDQDVKVVPSQKERAICADRCKKDVVMIVAKRQPLDWRCVECVIRHERGCVWGTKPNQYAQTFARHKRITPRNRRRKLPQVRIKKRKKLGHLNVAKYTCKGTEFAWRFHGEKGEVRFRTCAGILLKQT